MKTLNFSENLVPLVLSGEKTRTWRFFDEKDLQVGDVLTFTHQDHQKQFAIAEITRVYEKKLRDIAGEDLDGHEKFESPEEMLKTYRGYYGDRVNTETIVKIIDFKLIQ